MLGFALAFGSAAFAADTVQQISPPQEGTIPEIDPIALTPMLVELALFLMA